MTTPRTRVATVTTMLQTVAARGVPGLPGVDVVTGLRVPMSMNHAFSANVLGIVLAGGEGKRLWPLTTDRAKPAVPFGGNYRLIDFVLSNLVNAGLHRICVLTQYKSHSLDRHISTTWRLSSLLGQYITTVPAQQRLGRRWYTGSADAIYQSLNLVYDERPDYIAVFGADHVYRMDPSQMIARHIESGAGVTVAGIRVPRAEAKAFGCIASDETGRITEFLEKPSDPPSVPRRPPTSRSRPWATTCSPPRCCSTRSARTPRTATPPRHGRRHHPQAGRRGRGRRLRLRRQRGARCHRPRRGLLARRRDARRVLRGPHRPRVRAPDLQPLQRQVAHQHGDDAAAAREVRGGRHRPGLDRRAGTIISGASCAAR